MSIIQWRFLVPYLMLGGIVWNCPGQAEEKNPTLSHFVRDASDVETAITSEDFARATVVSASALFEWRSYADFPDLAHKIELAYSTLPVQRIAEFLRFRREWLEGNVAGVSWLDTGLLAKALGRPHVAVDAFRKTLEDDYCCRLPFMHCLLATALLDIRDVTGAINTFGEAVHSASGDESTLFRVRQMYADELYDHGRLNEAVQGVLECQISSYPLERAWALGQLVVYSWYEKDVKGVSETLPLLATALKEATPRADLDWQRRRWKQTEQTLRYAGEALSGSPEAQMVMDVEVADIFFKTHRPERVVELLQRWVNEYPMENRDQWNDATAYWALCAHNCFYGALYHVGRVEEAVQGYKRMLQMAGKSREFLVHANCWLGFHMRVTKKLDEAQKYFEEGLRLDERIDPGTVPPNGFERYYIYDGTVRPETRRMYVFHYSVLLADQIGSGVTR